MYNMTLQYNNKIVKKDDSIVCMMDFILLVKVQV